MRTSGGKRFDPSEARERCVSNGPQGEPRSGESSSITDQIQKPCSASRVFLYLKPDEDENLRGQEVRPERSERTPRLLAKFIDPLEEQRDSQEKVRRVRMNTFKNVAANWYEMKKAVGLKPHTLQDIWNSLNRYVFPHIGEINIDELTAQQVIAALESCRADGKLETVKRMTQRSEPASLCASGASKVTPRPDTLAFVGRIPAFWAQVKQINCCWHLSPF